MTHNERQLTIIALVLCGIVAISSVTAIAMLLTH